MISSDRETAINEDDVKLSNRLDREFQRTSRRARRMGYNGDDILRSDILGKIHACIESGDSEMEEFYMNILQNPD